MNKYQEAINGLKFTIQMFTFDPSNGETKTPDSLNEMDKITYDSVKFAHDYLEKYRWHDLRKNPNDLPDGREWVLAIFKEPDEDFTLAPRVADYVGKQTPITTKENWIIIDLDDAFDLSEYHRNLKCIAWKYIEEFEDDVIGKYFSN